MTDRGALTLSPHHDGRNLLIPNPHPFDSCNAGDPQTLAASNALCAMRNCDEPAFFQPATLCHEDEGSFYDSQMPSFIGSYEGTIWGGKETWREPAFAATAPDQIGSWMFGISEHIANGAIASNGTLGKYDVPSAASFPVVDHLPVATPFQQHTPPTENFAKYSYDCSAPLLPVHPTCSSAGSSTTSIKEEHEDMTRCVAMTDQYNGPAEKMSDVPYAKLIERALLEAKGNKLVLKDIYKWIEDNTEKASDPSFKGWQNSVRHNLSMNGAFTKIPLPRLGNKSQKGYMWILEPSAKKHGIQSTTRYRRKDETRRGGTKSAANDHHVRSGRRGGRAAQKLAKLKRNSLAASNSHPPQSIKDQSPSCSAGPGLGPRHNQESAPPFSVSGGCYQPYLPSPHPQSSFTETDCCTYDASYACTPFQPALQSTPGSHGGAMPTMLPALTSRVTDHVRGNYSAPCL